MFNVNDKDNANSITNDIFDLT